MWNDAVYQPGEIKVVAYDENNKAVAEQIIRTSGEPFMVKLTANRTTIKSGGKDLSFVTVEVLDKDGNLCPRADQLLFFKVNGAGTLKALCNGDPTQPIRPHLPPITCGRSMEKWRLLLSQPKKSEKLV